MELVHLMARAVLVVALQMRPVVAADLVGVEAELPPVLGMAVAADYLLAEMVEAIQITTKEEEVVERYPLGKLVAQHPEQVL